MTIKVSVVIPVYNPGEYVEDCIASLLRQSLPDDEYEAIFVDDGSTDSTPARLDALAAEHPHMHVIHQEPSGWSGKPRNVGIAAAQGEFVMFVDNDDWLGDEALERMYGYGVANEADIVIGKMAGKGRPVPRELFRVNRPRASVENAPLIDSLTPHKMFRKEFLDRHDLRFMEGRRRLEDHVFVAEAYLLASSVAVLSDYLCYYHIRRDDSSNAGFQRFDPVGYFKNLREALDVVERLTEPGPLRDRLYRRWLRNEMVERLRGSRFLRMDEDFRRELFAEARAVAVERFGPGVAAGLPPQQQAVAVLLADDRLDAVEELARWEARVLPSGSIEQLRWEDGALRIAVGAEYLVNGKHLTFRTEDGEDRLTALSDLGVEVPVPLRSSRIDLLLRERATSAEFFQPAESAYERVPGADGTFHIVLRADASVDPETAANGAPLGPGIWDVVIRIVWSGWAKETRVGSVHTEAAENGRRAALCGTPGRLVLPYWTDGPGNLSLDVDHATKKYDREVLRIAPEHARIADGTAELTLPLVVRETETGWLRYQPADGGAAVEVEATLRPAPEGAVLAAALPRPGAVTGTVRLEAGLPSAERGTPCWTALPLALDLTADGSASVDAPASRKAAAEMAREAAAKAQAEERRLRRTARKRPLWRRVAGRIRRDLRRALKK
ncbi:glycosyltransferase family 2 protein [Streptomyces mesophilus]|uniref:glycosyltransferase family 2 protein n=1 Tax=Streptomyces mesophilus TaxID=1775132 RepID=UPI00332B17AD